MVTKWMRSGVAVLALGLVVGGCSRTTAAVAGAAAAAAGVIAYNDRGATTEVGVSAVRLADATVMAFRELNIVLTERETEDDGIELKGADGDWKIVVDIEHETPQPRSSVEVTVSKDQINYDKSRSEQILRRILAHVQH